ncbi:bifunctional diaminohydroxyphosphoribosylaminopyrimidine deaminase/5-amino-6-(5-phosphoribosylamino)uracil reductase RibD [Candidatus Profftella armatura]|uniref:bifunctional diaminohydroxyphosphoribosylaminopyrimidine deaminase/5-amino-6-(5-phosphoribosylamino)uracil reductase RibD n=1 Tax=Candidatus Profftella armatura TaxID=669502 RepID=UPI003D98B4F9
MFFDSIDFMAMTLALQQAKLSINSSPNPRVGCVIVKEKRIISCGYTKSPGGNHAEIDALLNAAAQGYDVYNSTIYITLEPCSYFGYTPPCTEALIKSGIKKVIIAINDPNPLVSGKGVAQLISAGISVKQGLMQKEAYEINIGFFSRMQRGIPWVRMKIASSLDNKTSLYNNSSQWITSKESRNDSHIWRARSCAILTGIGTVLKDNPRLNVRSIKTSHQPYRIVIDSYLRIDPFFRVLKGGGSCIFTATDLPMKRKILEDLGHEVIVLPNNLGKVDLQAVIIELGKRKINELHIEAGYQLNTALILEGCVDELLLYISPILIGEAYNMFTLPPHYSLDKKIKLKFHEIQKIGPDIRILARF